ncbi:hypothetical protein [Aliivibrio wodanis]
MSNNKQPTTPRPIRVNDEKGLRPAMNPPKMPFVKPPKAEKSS